MTDLSEKFASLQAFLQTNGDVAQNTREQLLQAANVNAAAIVNAINGLTVTDGATAVLQDILLQSLVTNQRLFQIMNAVQDETPQPAGATLYEAINIIRTEVQQTGLSYWNSRIGVSIGPTDNILYYLRQLAQANQFGQEPPQLPEQVCSNYYVSNGTLQSSSRSFARFVAPLPNGLAYADGYSLAPSGAALVSELPEQWLGIQVFVRAQTARSWRIRPDSEESYPTGQWIELVGNISYVFAPSVAGEDAIEVYMCVPDAVNTCTDYNSELVGIVGFGTRQQIVWPTMATDTDPNGNQYTANVIKLANANGWTFQTVGNPSARLVYWRPNNPNPVVQNLGNNVFILPEDTSHLLVDDYQTGQGAFTVRVCV